jgi:D-inositol-3-phosphate glycosyltransferase
VRVISCGINSRMFRQLDRDWATAQCGFGSKKTALAVGRLEPVKGFDLLLRAAALVDGNEDFMMVIVGGDNSSGDRGAALKSLTAELKLVDKVVFAGRVDYERLPLYYNAATVTVIPSCYESFGLVALESLACNTPLVAGPVGVIPELLKLPGGDNHIHLVNGRHPAVWAGEISGALAVSEPAQGISSAELLAPFSWTSAAARLVDVCHMALGNKL